MTLEEAAVYFAMDQWAAGDPRKALYKDDAQENYDTLVTLSKYPMDAVGSSKLPG